MTPRAVFPAFARGIAFGLAFALAAGVAGCALAPAQPAKLTKVKVVANTLLSTAPFYLADKEGYFKEQGLEIEFTTLNKSSDAIPALVNGDIDVSGAGINVGFLNAMAREGSIKFVAASNTWDPAGCPAAALVARKTLVDSGALTNPAQMKGLRVSMTRGNYEEYWIERLVTSAGLTLSDLNTVDLPDPAEFDALKQGSVDLVSSSEPSITQMVANGVGVMFKGSAEVVPNFQSGFVVYGVNFLQRDPETGKKFMAAYLKGARRYKEGKTQSNVDIVVGFTKLDPAVVSQVCWIPLSSRGDINAAALLEFEQWAVKKGLLDTVVPEEKFSDGRFLEYANGVLDKAKP